MSIVNGRDPDVIQRDYVTEKRRSPQTALFVIAILIVLIVVIVIFIILWRRSVRNSSSSNNDNGGGNCTINTDCSGTQVCNTNTNTCVDCVADNNCPASAPLCRTTTNTCVKCLGNSDCPSSRPLCNGDTFTCVQCFGNSNCSGVTPLCDSTTSTCVGCLTNTNCTNPSTPYCSTGTKQCVQCINNSQCSSPLTCVGGFCCNSTPPTINSVAVSTVGGYRVAGTYSYTATPGLTEIYQVADNTGFVLVTSPGAAADGTIDIPQNDPDSTWSQFSFFSGFTYQISVAFSSDCGVTAYSAPQNVLWPTEYGAIAPVIASGSADTSTITINVSNPDCSSVFITDNFGFFISTTTSLDPNRADKVVDTFYVSVCSGNLAVTGSWPFAVSPGEQYYVRVAMVNPTALNRSAVLLSNPQLITVM